MSRRHYVIQTDLQLGNRHARTMRIMAKGIDFIIAFFFILLFYPWGVFFAIIFLSVIDAAHQGESVGKKLLGFRVISLEDHQPCSIKASVIRNLPVSLPFVFLLIPFWGVILFFCIFIPCCLLELFYILRLDSFHRLGDVLADTTVIANDPHHFYQKKGPRWQDDSIVPSV